MTLNVRLPPLEICYGPCHYGTSRPTPITYTVYVYSGRHARTTFLLYRTTHYTCNFRDDLFEYLHPKWRKTHSPLLKHFFRCWLHFNFLLVSSLLLLSFYEDKPFFYDCYTCPFMFHMKPLLFIFKTVLVSTLSLNSSFRLPILGLHLLRPGSDSNLKCSSSSPSLSN